mgnify:CR=1 FL=1
MSIRTRLPQGFRRFLLIASALGLTACAMPREATAQAPAPDVASKPIIAALDELNWRPVGNTGMMSALVHGDPGAAAPFTMVMKIPAGTKLPPHSHPDLWRTSIVVSGTLYFGFGDTWDEAALKPMKPGTVWTEPAGANHFLWAKDGEVIAKLTAMGPTGSKPAAPAK